MVAAPAELDIGWLFGAAESELGVRSNFPEGLYALVTRRGAKAKPEWACANVASVEDSAIAAIDSQRRSSRARAAAKLRRVFVRYRRLPIWAKVVLETAYEARQLPPELRGEPGCGQWALLCRLTPAGASHARRYLASATARREPWALQVRSEAEGLLAAALSVYASA